MRAKKNFNSNYRNRRFESSSSTSAPLKPTHILPSPGILESYEELAPGASKIILEMAKKEQEHRHKLDQDHLKEMVSIAKRGQIFGFSFVVVMVCGCIMLIMNSYNLMAIALAIVSFIGLGIVAMSNRGRNNFRRNQRSNQA